MKFIVSYLVKKFGIDLVVIVLDVLYIAFITAYFVFIMSALRDVFLLIQNFFNILSTGNNLVSPSDFNLFMGYLDAVGFLSALHTAVPLIISSIVFLLTSILYKQSKRAYDSYLKTATDVAKIL